MKILRSAEEMRAWALERKRAGERIGLVPTMGYLHRGHLSLVAQARRRADVVAASIFVNPTQFGPNEDFSRYPRDEAGDFAKLREAGVDAVLAPEAGGIYPPGFGTYVVPDELARHLCGASRPGHFRGVCTVVHLLFRISLCDVAVFGEKDFQQLQIIRRMARDLWLDVDVVGAPIVREPDGLAMSSRNAYLSADERAHALELSQALGAVQRAFAAGERRTAALLEVARGVLGPPEAIRVDYAQIVDPDTLEPVAVVDRPARVALAAFVGKTRLIDNAPLADLVG